MKRILILSICLFYFISQSQAQEIEGKYSKFQTNYDLKPLDRKEQSDLNTRIVALDNGDFIAASAFILPRKNVLVKLNSKMEKVWSKELGDGEWIRGDLFVKGDKIIFFSYTKGKDFYRNMFNLNGEEIEKKKLFELNEDFVFKTEFKSKGYSSYLTFSEPLNKINNFKNKANVILKAVKIFEDGKTEEYLLDTKLTKLNVFDYALIDENVYIFGRKDEVGDFVLIKLNLKNNSSEQFSLFQSPVKKWINKYNVFGAKGFSAVILNDISKKNHEFTVLGFNYLTNKPFVYRVPDRGIEDWGFWVHTEDSSSILISATSNTEKARGIYVFQVAIDEEKIYERSIDVDFTKFPCINDDYVNLFKTAFTSGSVTIQSIRYLPNKNIIINLQNQKVVTSSDYQTGRFYYGCIYYYVFSPDFKLIKNDYIPTVSSYTFSVNLGSSPNLGPHIFVTTEEGGYYFYNHSFAVAYSEIDFNGNKKNENTVIVKDFAGYFRRNLTTVLSNKEFLLFVDPSKLIIKGNLDIYRVKLK